MLCSASCLGAARCCWKGGVAAAALLAAGCAGRAPAVTAASVRWRAPSRPDASAGFSLSRLAARASACWRWEPAATAWLPRASASCAGASRRCLRAPAAVLRGREPANKTVVRRAAMWWIGREFLSMTGSAAAREANLRLGACVALQPGRWHLQDAPGQHPRHCCRPLARFPGLLLRACPCRCPE